jgi:GTP pyrophosphokinase
MLTINTRTSKQGIATVMVSFEIGGVEELHSLITKLRQIGGVMEVERSTG